MHARGGISPSGRRRRKIQRPFIQNPAMSTDTPPDRLALDKRSPYFNEAALDRGIGVRFKGVEYTNVAEYCVSEGWIRLPVGKSLDRRGNAMTFKHIGPVEVWYLT